MNNHGKIEKAKEQIVKYTAQLQNYDGDINKWKVIKELEKIDDKFFILLSIIAVLVSIGLSCLIHYYVLGWD